MIDARVRELLRERAGLVAESLGESAVVSVLERRARSAALPLPGYVARLLADPAEGAAFVEDVLVPETWFYRDLTPFSLLTELASQGRWGAQVRALSFPCSSGEEAFSIAIALAEAGLPQVSVEGWDLSARALARAREASYTTFSLRGTPDWLRERYLIDEGDRVRVRPEIAATARFRQANILDLDPRGGATFDVVLCRNLFIYLDRHARERALTSLRALLSPAGVLVLGHADGWPDPSAGLRSLGPPGAFAFEATRPAPRAAASPRPAPRPAPAASAPRPQPSPLPPLARTSPSSFGAPPAQFVRQASVLQPPATGGAPRTSLDEARALADRGELSAARALCEREASRAPLDPAAHRLLGVILLAQGDLRAGEGALRRALYLDPRDAEALTQLAALSERQGRPEEAASFRRRLAALEGAR